MAARSKGLTWPFKARLTEAEERAVRGAVAEYKESDITISLNDALRILIRRGARPLPRTLGPLDARIAEHETECEWCDDKITCPEMKRMGHARRVLADQSTPMLPGAEEYADQMGRASGPARVGVLAPRPAAVGVPSFLGGPGRI